MIHSPLGLLIAIALICFGTVLWMAAPYLAEDDYNVDAELNRALIEVIMQSDNIEDCSETDQSEGDGPSSTVTFSQVRENHPS